MRSAPSSGAAARGSRPPLSTRQGGLPRRPHQPPGERSSGGARLAEPHRNCPPPATHARPARGSCGPTASAGGAGDRHPLAQPPAPRACLARARVAHEDAGGHLPNTAPGRGAVPRRTRGAARQRGSSRAGEPALASRRPASTRATRARRAHAPRCPPPSPARAPLRATPPPHGLDRQGLPRRPPPPATAVGPTARHLPPPCSAATRTRGPPRQPSTPATPAPTPRRRRSRRPCRAGRHRSR